MKSRNKSESIPIASFKNVVEFDFLKIPFFQNGLIIDNYISRPLVAMGAEEIHQRNFTD